jgi:cobalamin biosynthesis Mg chelatase CobN
MTAEEPSSKRLKLPVQNNNVAITRDAAQGSSSKTHDRIDSRGAPAPAGEAEQAHSAALPAQTAASASASARHSKQLHGRPVPAPEDGTAQAAAAAAAASSVPSQQEKGSSQTSLSGMVIFLHGWVYALWLHQLLLLLLLLLLLFLVLCVCCGGIPVCMRGMPRHVTGAC